MKPLLIALLVAAPLLAQTFDKEGKQFDEWCVSFKPADCGQLLFTGTPLHIAVGSLAPDNGMGAGVAFVYHWTPNENWRIFWNADAVGTENGSWRAGGYMSAVVIRHPKIVFGPATKKKSNLALQEMPVLHAYAQSTSLNRVDFYGVGQQQSGPPKTSFGFSETIGGGNIVWPIASALNLSLLAEANGRFAGVHNGSDSKYAQFGEGVRLRPRFADGHVQLNYLAVVQEWAGSAPSFRRIKLDLDHEFPLYRNSRSLLPRDFNGPDSCSADPNSTRCPAISRNLEGSFGLRFVYSTSYSGGAPIPFYLDPTIGGSDINGTPLLPSYPDYRFRGPDVMVLRGTFEHSIYKWPVGAKFLVDEGRVGLTPGDLGFTHLAHSYAVGLTLHAGGLPVLEFLYAWGGHSTHTIADVSPELLGGTPRPSLY